MVTDGVCVCGGGRCQDTAGLEVREWERGQFQRVDFLSRRLSKMFPTWRNYPFLSPWKGEHTLCEQLMLLLAYWYNGLALSCRCLKIKEPIFWKALYRFSFKFNLLSRNFSNFSMTNFTFIHWAGEAWFCFIGCQLPSPRVWEFVVLTMHIKSVSKSWQALFYSLS